VADIPWRIFEKDFWNFRKGLPLLLRSGGHINKLFQQLSSKIVMSAEKIGSFSWKPVKKKAS
jgi:hypothetical protein